MSSGQRDKVHYQSLETEVTVNPDEEENPEKKKEEARQRILKRRKKLDLIQKVLLSFIAVLSIILIYLLFIAYNQYKTDNKAIINDQAAKELNKKEREEYESLKKAKNDFESLKKAKNDFESKIQQMKQQKAREIQSALNSQRQEFKKQMQQMQRRGRQSINGRQVPARVPHQQNTQPRKPESGPGHRSLSRFKFREYLSRKTQNIENQIQVLYNENNDVYNEANSLRKKISSHRKSKFFKKYREFLESTVQPAMSDGRKEGYTFDYFEPEKLKPIIESSPSGKIAAEKYTQKYAESNKEKFKLHLEDNAQFFTRYSDQRKQFFFNKFNQYLSKPYFRRHVDMLEDYQETAKKSIASDPLKYYNLTVHAIPHSHVDLGWLSTYEGYSRDTNRIYENVVNRLSEAKQRTFSVEHVGYFRLFYERTTTQMREKARKLIQNGQLEFLNKGAVSLHDEACSYYSDIITNFRAGPDWFKSIFMDNKTFIELNKKKARSKDPKEYPFHLSSAYKIDSFGHSLGTLHLELTNGVSTMLLNRVDTVEKRARGFENTLTFNWKYNRNQAKGQKQPPNPENLLTYIMRKHYRYPLAIKRIRNGALNPLQYRFPSQVKTIYTLLNDLNKWADFHYKRQMPVVVGDDFTYSGYNNDDFRRLDNFIIFVTSQGKTGRFQNVKVKYSNLRNYFNSVKDDFAKKAESKEEKAVTKNRDFYPYTNRVTRILDTGGTWTGFFTTHSWYKRRYQSFGRNIRNLLNFLSKKVLVAALKPGKKAKNIFPEIFIPRLSKVAEEMKWWTSVLTHHDAITGTSRRYVMQDYQANLEGKIRKFLRLISMSASNNSPRGPEGEHQIEFLHCEDYNRHCLPDPEMNENLLKSEYYLGLFSAKTTWSQFFDWSLPENINPDYEWKMIDNGGNQLESWLECEKKSPVYIYHLNSGDWGNQRLQRRMAEHGLTDCLRTFRIPANTSNPEFYSLKYHQVPKNYQKKISKSTKFFAKKFIIEDLSGNKEAVYVSYNTNETRIIINWGQKTSVEIGWLLHFGIMRDGRYQNDGPYVMNLENQHPEFLRIHNLRYIEHKDHLKILADEYKYGFGRIEVKIPKAQKNLPHPSMKALEVIHRTNKLDVIEKNRSYDIFTYYKMIDFSNLLTFWTDSNGLDLIERRFRVRKDRYTESPFRKEYNVFPINKIIYTKNYFDEKEVFGVVVDRPCGGLIAELGMIEVNIRRTTKASDNKGMNEHSEEVNEEDIKHTVVIGSSGERDLLKYIRREQIKEENRPVLAVAIQKLKEKSLAKLNKILANGYLQANQKGFSFAEIFKDELDKNVQIGVDFEILNGKNSLLVTLVNLNDFDLATVEGIGLKLRRWVFEKEEGVVKFGEILETNLNYFGVKDQGDSKALRKRVEEGKIVLNPLQIRTFVIELLSK